MATSEGAHSTKKLLDKALSPRRVTALNGLLHYLTKSNYHFVTPTPATHQRVVERRNIANTVIDILGWSLPFPIDRADPELVCFLREADMVTIGRGGLARANIRVSSIHDRLFIHSSFPTLAEDSVFLGPDSYRFADLIRSELSALTLIEENVVLDMGTGAGVGALVAADLFPEATVVMTDLNARALSFALINVDHAGRSIAAYHGRDFADYLGSVDIAMANPPYIIDPAGRAYRDGRGELGAEIAINMTHAALSRLQPAGQFILYTGSAIVASVDGLQHALMALARQFGRRLRYRELDPDVFGEELENPGYECVDRIAVVSAIFS